MRKQNEPNKRNSKEGNSSNKKEQEKGNVFDRIFKENIREIRKPIAEELLGKPILSIRPMPAKMQSTLEIEGDDFFIVKFRNGVEEILHLEFELTLKDNMVYRVGEYHGVKQRQLPLPIHHFVFNIGKGKKKVRTQLHENEIYRGFILVHANEKPAEEYLASDIPEIVIMAVLGDYSDERKDEIVRLIISRLQTLIGNKRKLNKYIKQLYIFGRIRKLENILTKNVQDMTTFNYDITKDGLYIKGTEKGAEKERKLAEERNIESIKALLLNGRLTQNEISICLNVPISLVLKLKKELDLKK